MNIQADLNEARIILDQLIAERHEAERAYNLAGMQYHSARRQFYEALDRVDEQRHVVARLQDMMMAAGAEVGGVDAGRDEDAT